MHKSAIRKCTTLRHDFFRRQAAIRKAVPGRCKVNVIRFADDFIVTGISLELLRDVVLPVVIAFLKERGLSLSEEKTHITRIEDGFNFLGQYLRKFAGKLIIQPTKTAAQAIVAKTKEIIRTHRGKRADVMIGKLNPVIRGWANYHRFVCSSAAFAWVDSCIYQQLWRWARRRHKSNWQFFETVKGKGGQRKVVDLFRAVGVKIVRHVKIRGEANPYDPALKEYFRERAARGWARLHPALTGCTI